MSAIQLIHDANAVDPRVAAVFAAVRCEYGFVPNILRAIANCPELLEVFTPFWGRVYESPRIGGKLRAISALGTAHSRRCGYCIAHMSESARRAGINDAELAAIAQGDANKLLSTRERAALQYATELSGQSGEAHESIRILEGHFDDGEIVNITLAVGLYNLTSLFLQSLRIEVDDALRR